MEKKDCIGLSFQFEDKECAICLDNEDCFFKCAELEPNADILWRDFISKKK